MTEVIQNGKMPPPVRRSDGVIVPFTKDLIVKSLVKETQLVSVLYGENPLTEQEAMTIASEVEEEITRMQLKMLSGPLIREIVKREAPRARVRKAQERVYKGWHAALRRLPDRQLGGLRVQGECEPSGKSRDLPQEEGRLPQQGILPSHDPLSYCRCSSAGRHPSPRSRILGHSPILPGLGSAILLLLRAYAPTAQAHTRLSPGPPSMPRLRYSTPRRSWGQHRPTSRADKDSSTSPYSWLPT